MLLKDKNAVIYGAGGGIGGGVARTFALEGARVFLVGRTREKLETVAADIIASGGQAEVAVLDVLDEPAVEEHARLVAARAGSIDISFNLINRGDVQGVPLIEMTTAQLTKAVTTGLMANFITARAAARHMIEQKSGVILMLTSASSEVTPPMMGSTAPADAAMEALMHTLAAELGPHGVRVIGLWTAGVRETLSPEKFAAVNHTMVMDDASFQQVLQGIAGMTMLRRAPALAQVADTAAFLASDRASGITGTIVNVTCGMVAR
jgi:NAD(P)-dependent dehydrogenase (short-subunit alcohol dehydrogenase family)